MTKQNKTQLIVPHFIKIFYTYHCFIFGPSFHQEDPCFEKETITTSFYKHNNQEPSSQDDMILYVYRKVYHSKKKLAT